MTRRMRIHLPPDEHGTRTVRGIGFVYDCPVCGFVTRPTKSLAVYRERKAAHELWHGTNPRVSVSGPV